MTRTGNTLANLTVNYTVGGTATAGSDYTTLSGSVIIPIGSATATITVAAIDDQIADPGETVIVTLTPNAPTYTVKIPNQATVTINDNDLANLAVSAMSGPTSEDGGTATFTVKLNSQPIADVTVAVTSLNVGEGKVSSVGSPIPGATLNLTFTAANWNTLQTVTVTGQNDTNTDPAQGYQISVGFPSSAMRTIRA